MITALSRCMRKSYALIAIALLLAACAGNINPSRQLDDAALATSVRNALQADAALKPYAIRVDVRSGDVTLTGSVRSTDLRDRATNVVRNVADVKNVRNLLTVE